MNIAANLKKHTKKRLVRSGLITHKRLEELADGGDFLSEVQAVANREACHRELERMKEKDFKKLMEKREAGHG